MQGEEGVSEEIPSKSINFLNEQEETSTDKLLETTRATTPEAKAQFSPIKFGGLTDKIVDEEITINHLARKDKEGSEPDCATEESSISSGGNTSSTARLQRKSDEEICNTPKRERNFEDSNLNIRNRAREEADTKLEPEENGNGLLKTPQKIGGLLVKSLSMEFEHRLASIHVSPKIQSAAPRSMSPVRCIAELSPVSKLNLNEEATARRISVNANSTSASDSNNFMIEEPKLVSPSKIVAAASAVEIEKIRIDLESKVRT